MCVCKEWRDFLRDDNDDLWQQLCARDFMVGAVPTAPPVPQTGYVQSLPSFREAYAAWQAHFRGYDLSLVTRALRAWKQIEEWTGAAIPVVAESLRWEGRV